MLRMAGRCGPALLIPGSRPSRALHERVRHHDRLVRRDPSSGGIVIAAYYDGSFSLVWPMLDGLAIGAVPQVLVEWARE